MSFNGTEFECGSSSKVILKASSTTVDFEAEPQEFHCVQLSGSWARERYVHDTRLQAGVHSFGSVQGVSSHQHNPFGGKLLLSYTALSYLLKFITLYSNYVWYTTRVTW